MQLENVRKLLGTLKEYDLDVWKHSIFVMKFSYEIIKSLKLNHKDVRNILLGSLLHDIGKLKISKEIINKPGKLNQEEWGEIKKHPAYGASIITQHKIPQDILPLILYHHERWDGQGYYGLQGNEICYGARIIALADSVEAMSSERPYQKAKETKEILLELFKNRGSQFEPHLINLIFQMQTTNNPKIITTSDKFRNEEKILNQLILKSRNVNHDIFY